MVLNGTIVNSKVMDFIFWAAAHSGLEVVKKSLADRKIPKPN